MAAMLRLLALLTLAMCGAFGLAPPEPVGRRGRGLRLGRGTDPTFCGSATVGGRRVYLYSDGTSKPALAGGEGENNPPAPPAPDLAGLETALNAAKTEAQQEAQSEMLKALGFEKREDAVAWVKAKRDEEDQGKTEQQRLLEQAQREASEARLQAAQSATTARDARVRAQLAIAGAPGEHVADLSKLVALPDGDITDEQIATAVEATKTKFAALFTAPAAPPAPSGLPGGGPPKPPGAADPLEAGRQRAAATKKKRIGASRDDLIAQFSPQPSPLATTN